jgi:hypothetical protein
MIHHVSIPAHDPRGVADVLADLLQGRAFPFPGGVPGAYMAVSGDAHGTMIEIYPETTTLELGDDAVAFGEAGGTVPRSSAFHVLVSVPHEREAVERIGQRAGWRTRFLGRGAPGQPPVFHVIELWIENRFLIEVATPSMVAAYTNTVQFATLDRLFAPAASAVG